MVITVAPGSISLKSNKRACEMENICKIKMLKMFMMINTAFARSGMLKKGSATLLF
jgi:hypothetical protein